MKRTILSVCGLLLTVASFAQQPKVIKLKNLPPLHNPKGFYISGVVDDRDDSLTIGTMKAGLTGKVTPITLQGGPAKGMMDYLNENLKQNKGLLPVEIHLNRFEVKEEKQGVTPTVYLYSELSFNTRGMNVYRITAQNYAQGGYDVSGFIGKLVQQAMDYHLKAFDDWLSDNPISATGNNMDVSLKMMTTDSDPNLIPYTNGRKLQRSDFKGKVDDLSSAAAVTLSGISIKYGWERTGGKTKVKIELLPYFNTNLSWWRAKSNTPEILAHEQLHFDITAVYACELKDKLEHTVFQLDGLEQQINRVMTEVESQRVATQQQYDNEAQHGLNKAKQAEWQNKVADMLAKQPCY
ncbi:MAG: hypothetical protein EOP51_08855 [Sphingobacteriales bacterium]|nr:MAG: hypothetical protein EOP51_08855 [Sphingobacteriales bacterium]